MESLQEKITLVKKVCEIYEKLSKLETLKPCNEVDKLFTELVDTCIPPSSINIATLSDSIQDIRSKLIRLCGEAEGHLEAHYSTILGSFKDPLHHLNIFPYLSNYLKLSRLEYNILSQHYSTTQAPKHVAFVGSGPLPLTSTLLASCHLKETTFHNYDIDSLANAMASRLVASDDDLCNRMIFHTTDIMDVAHELKMYDVIFLAALVGMDVDEKVKVIQHLSQHMAPGAILMLRSAHGARAFLYPVVDPQLLQGFDVLSIIHPEDEVINSVLISRKCWKLANTIHHNTLLHNLSFVNFKTLENASSKLTSNRFATETLASKNLCWQSSVRAATLTTEMTSRPMLVTKQVVPIFPTDFSTPLFCDMISDRHDLFLICDCIFMQPPCGRLFCNRKCRCLFCGRFSVTYLSQICYRTLKKKLPRV